MRALAPIYCSCAAAFAMVTVPVMAGSAVSAAPRTKASKSRLAPHAIAREPRYPAPVLPFESGKPIAEPIPTVTLADAIARAYQGNPSLAARRYDLRSTDETLGQALAELRPTAEVQLSGGYDKTVPGRTTQANRSLADQLASPIITRNDLGLQLTVNQPLLTGGRATADIGAAREDIRAGREALRGTEGDLLVQVIGAYVDIRRDTQALAIRKTNVRVLESTLAEVVARREAGELTRTDIAQAETQLMSARVQESAAAGQLEASRAGYAALVGENPGVLAREPALPMVPRTIDEAFDSAERFNPELAQAIHAERASRSRILAARAEGNPTLSLRGTAGLSGQAIPYDLRNEDQSFGGRATLTIPLSQGGRVASLIAQASSRNAADRLRIEAARRQLVQNIVTAWNQIVTSERNAAAQQIQLEAARVYYEGTFEEYRAGLRSTFDVLYAQNALRDTEIGLLASRRDLYFAKATLLRHIGQLEVAKLMTGTGLYDPSGNVRRVERRNALPWDPAVRALDSLDSSIERQQVIEQPARIPDTPRIVTGTPATDRPLVTNSPTVPMPGTIGVPDRPKQP